MESEKKLDPAAKPLEQFFKHIHFQAFQKSFPPDLVTSEA